jgi:hypothetical protein
MRDRVINPHDLGLLFAMVPGMPESFAERFKAAESWSRVVALHEELVERCERDGVTIIL